MIEEEGRVARVVAALVGFKGAVFLQAGLEAGIRFGKVCSYDDRSDLSRSHDRILTLANEASIPVEIGRHPTWAHTDLTFLVGWQYLIRCPGTTLIVFHDSLLPAYRGFSPTVTAMIEGDEHIGVTALLASEELDAGPIVGQRGFTVSYPMRIEEALRRQANLMADLACAIVEDWKRCTLVPRCQDHSTASYSLWRDAADYEIDWRRSAAEIARFIDAVGFPYEGARTSFAGKRIVVREVVPVRDLPFVRRAPGKIWQIREGRPVIVCGEGLLLIQNAELPDGRPVLFDRLRCRLGRGDAG